LLSLSLSLSGSLAALPLRLAPLSESRRAALALVACSFGSGKSGASSMVIAPLLLSPSTRVVDDPLRAPYVGSLGPT